jgi:iron complex transport system substrate-binding protein
MSRVIATVLVLCSLGVAACGGEDASPTTAAPQATTASTGASQATTASTVATETTAEVATTAADTRFPLTVASEAGEVTLESAPERIVALSATHVEILYALGAAEQLVAGDLFSNYPAEALDLVQVDSFNLSVESVIALDPDLVILTFDPVGAVPAFQAVGIPTLLFETATTLDAAYEQMAVLGTATGRVEEADALVRQMQADIAAIVEDTRDMTAGLTYYHESDPFSYYTPNSSSFIGQLYGLLGMDNIADEAPDDFGSGFPQLNPEFIVASDPDIIFLAAFGESPETVAARNGWDTMTAVAEGRMATLDPDVASRWGPRVVDLLAAIAAAIPAS